MPCDVCITKGAGAPADATQRDFCVPVPGFCSCVWLLLGSHHPAPPAFRTRNQGECRESPWSAARHRDGGSPLSRLAEMAQGLRARVNPREVSCGTEPGSHRSSSSHQRGMKLLGGSRAREGGAARGGVGAAQRGAGRGTYQRDCPSIKRVPASPDETRSQARSHPTPRAALKAALNQRILFKFIQDVAVFFCSDRRGIWKCSFFLFFLSFFFFIAVLKRSLAV